MSPDLESAVEASARVWFAEYVGVPPLSEWFPAALRLQGHIDLIISLYVPTLNAEEVRDLIVAADARLRRE